jgi:hypothetical protein
LQPSSGASASIVGTISDSDSSVSSCSKPSVAELCSNTTRFSRLTRSGASAVEKAKDVVLDRVRRRALPARNGAVLDERSVEHAVQCGAVAGTVEKHSYAVGCCFTVVSDVEKLGDCAAHRIMRHDLEQWLRLRERCHQQAVISVSTEPDGRIGAAIGGSLGIGRPAGATRHRRCH